MSKKYYIALLLPIILLGNDISKLENIAKDKTNIENYLKANHQLSIYYVFKNRNYKKAVYYIDNILNTKDFKKHVMSEFMYKSLLGSIYITGGYGIKTDYKKAYENLIESYKFETSSATCNLGYLYEKGLYVKKDLKKAFELYKTSANNDFIVCKHNMGVFYFDGIVVKQDYKKAYEWFTKAYDLKTNKGFFKSKFYIYDMKCKGLGTSQDPRACDALNRVY